MIKKMPLVRKKIAANKVFSNTLNIDEIYN